MLSRAASIAANIARWVAGPSTRICASLPSKLGAVAGGVRGGSAGADAHAVATASTTPTTRRFIKATSAPGLAAGRRGLDADVVLDRTNAIHLLRGVGGAARLVVGIRESGELHHSAIGLDV